MWHILKNDAPWWVAMLAADEQLAAQVQGRGCVHCGGRLDRADYPRKVRGVPPAAEREFARRISFCCRRDGCRRRATPASLRFLGRRVYAGAVVALAGAERIAEVPRRTGKRWLDWWRTTFIASSAWRLGRGQFAIAVSEDDLPGSLLSRFGDHADGLKQMLRWLASLFDTVAFHEGR